MKFSGERNFETNFDLQALGEAVLAALGAVADWAKANGPAYYDWAATKAIDAYKSVQEMING